LPLWPYKISLFRPFSFKVLSSPSFTLTHCGCKISSLSRFTLNLVLSFWSSLLSRQHLSFYNCSVSIVSSRHGAHTVAHWASAVLRRWHLGGLQARRWDPACAQARLFH
jgi:hypothetical protein